MRSAQPGGAVPRAVDAHPVVALFGEWNTTNLGDQAIGLRAAQYFIGYGYNVKLFALGSLVFLGEVNDGNVASFFARRDAVAHNRKDVRPLRAVVRKALPAVEHVWRFARNRERFVTLRQHLAACCMMAVGGGDLLNQRYIHFISPLHLIAAYSRETKIPLVCVGCSSSERFTGLRGSVLKTFIRSARIIAVRDRATQDSVQRFCTHPVSLFGDFAFSLRGNADRKLRKTGRVAVNIMRCEQGHRRYRAFVEELIRRLVELGLGVILYTTGNHQDNDVLDDITTVFGGFLRTVKTESLEELARLHDEVDLVVASRLHAGILSLESGTPAVAIYRSRKIKNFFDTLGLHDYCFPVDLVNGLPGLLACVKNESYAHLFASLRLDDIRSGQRLLDRQLHYVMEG